jgi:phosphatidylglycerophosphate synthase/CTP:molybdopterin cytidylyltransferase MocA
MREIIDAVVLMAGTGSRLRASGELLPKVECLVIVDSPAASVELCGISMLERSLRTLQACGFTRALILTDSEELTSEASLASSPHWTKIVWNFAARRTGPVTLEQLAAVWPDDHRDLLVLRGDSVFDARLLRLLRTQASPVALVDSAVPANLLPLVSAAPMTTRGRFCGAALLSRDWVTGRSAPLEEALCAGLEDGSLVAFDVATQSWYSAELHRDLRAYWFPFPSPAHNKLAEDVILDAAQKGTLDIPALVHAPIEAFIVGKLCKTSVTPNQLTIFCNIIAWGATVLFATGNLACGIAVALAVGVLDGLDGKLARVKLETSKTGKLEHFFDVLFENSWWIALAFYLQSAGKLPGAYHYLLLLLSAEVLAKLARSSIVRSSGKSIGELSRFDRIVRLVGARRNVHVWILAVGIVLRNPAGAFVLIAWWEAITAAAHLPRAAWSLWVGRSNASRKGRSPFQKPAQP